MTIHIDDATCPQCGQKTLEQRPGERDDNRKFEIIVCTSCGHQPNLYDIGRQQIENARKRDQDGGC